MTRNRKSNYNKAINNILKELSSCFEATYAELLANLVRKSNFKQLRRHGEQQFFSAAESNHTLEEESKRIKKQFAEINLLAIKADSTIDTVVTEKLQGDFLSMLKEEVLEIVLKLYSEQDGSAQEKSKNSEPLVSVGNPIESEEKASLKVVLDRIKDVSKYFAQNLDDISKQVIDMPLEKATDVAENIETVIPNNKKEQIKETVSVNFEPENISFDSVSSVHTSDLSSFSDAISVSSNEETGNKRKRISFKLAEEEVKQLKAKKMKAGSNMEEQDKNIQQKDSEPDVPSKISSIAEQMSLPPRVRKPNSKYSEFAIKSPIRIMSSEKYTGVKSSTPVKAADVTSSLPRKRGRPRKNV